MSASFHSFLVSPEAADYLAISLARVVLLLLGGLVSQGEKLSHAVPLVPVYTPSLAISYLHSIAYFNFSPALNGITFTPSLPMIWGT